jgi:beta-glucosidase-like glycosyl hydrolase
LIENKIKRKTMNTISRVIILLAITQLSHAYQLPADPEKLVSTMTLRQKIAQCIIVAAVSNEQINKDFMAYTPYHMDIHHVEHLIMHEHVGGVLFLGGGICKEQMQITKHFQQISPHIPLLIALDAEWGLSMRLRDGIRFPRNMTLGALADDELIYQMALEIGKELAALGVHMNLAPVMDVNNNPNNPVINDRSFGSNPQEVAHKGCAYIKGLHDAGIIDCVKHFPGHGDTDVDSHVAMPIINHDVTCLHTIELFPFKKAIEHGCKSVMIGHMHIPALDASAVIPATLSKKITTDLLRTELGFDGLIVTDGLGMSGISLTSEPGDMEVRALRAGADILLVPVDVTIAIDAIQKAVQTGLLSEEEINAKVLRILKAKAWAFSQQHAAPACKADAIKLKKKLYSKAITIAKDTVHTTTDVTFALTKMHKNKKQNYGIPQEKIDEIKTLKALGKTVTVILYGSPYAVELVQDADRIIVAYEDDAATQEAVQQILAGFASAEGTLPV